MIRFQCPKCHTVYSVDDEHMGRKSTCKTCGQRLQVPQPPNKTVIGEPVPSKKRSSDNEPSGPFDFSEQPIPTAKHASPGTEETEDFGNSIAIKKHSALGIASFLIALTVGGMDLILIFIFAVHIFTAGAANFQQAVAANFVGGGLSIYCVNCLAIPLCIVGLGLGGVALIAHKQCNHLFSWIGLVGNTILILFVLGLYAAAQVLNSMNRPNPVNVPVIPGPRRF